VNIQPSALIAKLCGPGMAFTFLAATVLRGMQSFSLRLVD
jgi:hypothetical protein